MIPFAFTGNQIPKGILDFSYLLDAPAGKHGFLKSKDGKFYFEDGTPIKFFGVNLVFGSAMPPHETAEIIAERLARNGINMVRMHHVDAQGGTTLIDYSDGKSQALHKANIEKFDYLVYKLKEKGIYVHIDTHTLRKFMPGDGLDFEDDLPQGVKTVTYYNKRVIELHRDYMQKYLMHENKYTGMRYIDDPCIAIVQMVNENSIFWFNELEMPPSYESELNQLWNKWLLEKYKNRAALEFAWTSLEGKCALFADEDPSMSSVKGPLIGIWGEKVIEHDWDDYSKYESQARNADSVLFCTEVSNNYYTDTEKYLRGMGVKCVINLTNLPANIAELYAIAQGEVVENNGYWNHPEGGFRVPVKFHDGEMVKLDPRKNHPFGFSQNLVSKFASSKVKGKPLVITEWNVCYPTAFRSDVMLTLASYGAYQDWDGLILFSYAHQASEDFATKDKIEGFFDSYNDPAMWGMAGICSAVFQGKFISPPKRKVEIAYTPEDRTAATRHNSVYYSSLPFMTGVSVRFIEDKYDGDADIVISGINTPTGDYTGAKRALVGAISKYKDGFQREDSSEAFKKLHASRDNIKIFDNLEDLESAFNDISDGKYVDGIFKNDTDELTYNFGKGIFSVDTAQVKALCGYLQAGVATRGFEVLIENEKASVIAISRDGKNLVDSGSVLLAVIGNCSNSDMIWEGKTLVHPGNGPTLIEKIQGDISICSNKVSCNAYALKPDGTRAEELKVKKTDGVFCVNISSESDTIYYELELA